MPKSLAREQEALGKILSRIEEETLDPAKLEADKIVRDAQNKAESILKQATVERDQILAAGRATLKKEQEVGLSTLQQAGKEGLESLRQKVQGEFFEKTVSSMIDQKMQDPAILDKIIDALLQALKKEGLESRFSIVLPKVVSSKDLADMTAKYALSTLQADAKAGELSGGVQLRLHDQHMTLDFSSKAISDLLLPYIRKDLRDLLFGNA